MRRKAGRSGRRRGTAGRASAVDAAPAPARSRASQTWAMLIKRVYEIDPLACPSVAGR